MSNTHERKFKIMKLKSKRRIKFLKKIKPRRRRKNLKNKKNLKNRIFSIFSISTIIISMFINDKLKYNNRVSAITDDLQEKGVQIQLPTTNEESVPQPANSPSQPNIKTITKEEYLVGVLAGEMAHTNKKEALMAQAIAANTFAITNKDKQPFPIDSSFQVYKSEGDRKKIFGKQFDKKESELKEVVKSTAGKVIIHKGQPISSVYFSSSSGKTQNAEDVWGYKHEYLISVDSPENVKITKKTINYDKLFEIVHQKHNEARQPDPKEKDKAIEIDNSRTVAGHVISLKIFGIKFTANQFRIMLKLASTNFSISFDAEKNEFLIECRGEGHDVGLSQEGAIKMAEDGKNHVEIIKHYYPNVEIVDIKELNLKNNYQNDKNKNEEYEKIKINSQTT